jgi:hypothetical protein
LTGEFGIKKVLFEETAEEGVRTVDSWLLGLGLAELELPPPKIEWGPPAGVEG